jgi:Zn-dependent protease
MSLFILTAGLLILGVLGAFVVVASRRRVWPPRVESVELEAIPEDHFERMRPVAEELTRLGLRFEGFQCETCGPDEQVWQAVFGSRDGSVWAVSESGRRGGAGLVLHSFISNGRTVTTSDGEFSSLRATDDWRLSEFSWNDILAQVDFHRQACLGAGGHVVGLPQADEFKDLFAAAMEKQLDHLLSTRALREDAGEPGAMRLSPCRAPRVSLRLILHQRLVQWREKNRGRQRKEAAEVDAAAGERERYEQVKGFKYLDYYRRDRQSGGLLTRLGWSGKGVVLFASLVVLAVVLYLRGTLDAGSLGIIAGVLLVHEAGHLGMMKLFGYRDLSVFLLPGAGVAAGGGKVRPPAWQEFWVLMSGPLPGLLAGGAVMVHAYLHGGVSEFWQQWAWFSVVVNGFSLLPVVPFDGGRVVELLLLERMPLLRVIYQVLGAVFLVLLGALDWVLLLLAVPAIAAIPDAWRIFRMGSWIRKNLSPEHDDREALLRTFQIIDQTHSAGALGKPGWTLFVDKLLRMGCSRKLGIAAALVAMIAYLAILLLPVMLVGGAALRERHCYLAERDFVKQRALALAHKVETRGSAVMPVTRAAMEQLEARQAVARRFGVEAAAGSGMGDRAVIRGLAWEQVAAWVEEEGGGERREVVRDAIEALVGHAGRAVRDGDVGEGMEDLTLAYEAVLACEPRAALHEWIDWA